MAFFKYYFLTLTVMLMVLSNHVSGQDKINHYLYTGFEPAVVLFKSGVTEETGLNYNTLTEEMVYIQQGAYYALDQIGNIDTIFLNKNRFIPYENYFLEVRQKEKVILFIRHRNKLINTGSSTTFGSSQTNAIDNISNIISTGKVYDLEIAGDYKMVPEYSYFLKVDNQFQRIASIKDLSRQFPGRDKDIRDYIRSNKIKINQTDDLLGLLVYLESK
jgi:hypothetical protein